MARRRRLERRGRPRKIGAKRRETTAAARRAEPDKGTRELRRRKRRVTTREDLEVTPIAALFGHGHLDAMQHDTLAQIADWIRTLARNLGPKPEAVAGLWGALTGAATGSPQSGVPNSVGPAADHARYVLRRMLRRLDGSRDLVLQLAANQPVPLVMRVIELRLSRSDEIELDRLRDNLDRVAGQKRREVRA